MRPRKKDKEEKRKEERKTTRKSEQKERCWKQNKQGSSREKAWKQDKPGWVDSSIIFSGFRTCISKLEEQITKNSDCGIAKETRGRLRKRRRRRRGRFRVVRTAFKQEGTRNIIDWNFRRQEREVKRNVYRGRERRERNCFLLLRNKMKDFVCLSSSRRRIRKEGFLFMSCEQIHTQIDCTLRSRIVWIRFRFDRKQKRLFFFVVVSDNIKIEITPFSIKASIRSRNASA